MLSHVLYIVKKDYHMEIKYTTQNFTGYDARKLKGLFVSDKRCAETLMMDYHRHKNIDTRIIRIFNTYGPNMHPEDGRVVSNFIMQALRGEDITIYGDGSQTRSFCYSFYSFLSFNSI